MENVNNPVNESLIALITLQSSCNCTSLAVLRLFISPCECLALFYVADFIKMLQLLLLLSTVLCQALSSQLEIPQV
jgi:hypothetical protein